MRIFPMALVAAVAPATSFAAEIPADSRIKAVTVFDERAQVTRNARVSVPAGTHTLVFEGLPAQLLTDSLRAEVGPDSKLAIGSIESRRVIGDQPASEKERQLLRTLTELRDRRDLVGADIAALEVKRTFIEAIGKMAPDAAGKDLKRSDMQPERWQQAWTTLESGAAETFRALVQKRVEQRSLDEQIGKVEEELRRVQTGRRDSLTVRVNVQSTGDSSPDVALTYQVQEAGWRPTYEARLDTAAARLVLHQQGAVSQRTGEEWQGVELTLSTARPSLGTRAPELPTWWIDFPQPRPAVQAAPEARMLMKRESADAATLEPAETLATEFAAEYRIAGPATVPADSSERRVGIASHALPVSLSLRIVPKISTSAYLTVEGGYAGEAPLLPGALSLFRDGAFIGNGRMDMIRTDETLRMSFGTDDKVRVRRTQLAAETSQQGIVAKDRRVERKYRTAIDNLHRQPVKIAVHDNLPVSRNENIRVEILTNATTPGFVRNFDDRPGLLVWESTFAPGEKKSVDFGYAVTFPADQSVPGF